MRLNNLSESADAVKLPRAKPVILSFYDWLKVYPYTSTFYMRDEASIEQINALIKVVRGLSNCVLGSYRIGHEQYTIPDYVEQLKTLTPEVMGTRKWVIGYRVEYGSARSVTIPGRKHEYTLAGRYGGGLKGRSDLPDAENPVWQEFWGLFKVICCSSEGQPVLDLVKLDYSNDKWPPKGWKKRQ